MSEGAREPLFFEDVEEDLEPEPSTESAGVGGPPTAVGSGLEGDGGEDEPPIEGGMVRGDDPRSEGQLLRHFGAAINLLIEVYSLPIEDLGLSERAYGGLKRSGLIRVGQVLKKTEAELLALRDFGRAGYDELRQKLDERGILPNQTSVN